MFISRWRQCDQLSVTELIIRSIFAFRQLNKLVQSESGSRRHINNQFTAKVAGSAIPRRQRSCSMTPVRDPRYAAKTRPAILPGKSKFVRIRGRLAECGERSLKRAFRR